MWSSTEERWTSQAEVRGIVQDKASWQEKVAAYAPHGAERTKLSNVEESKGNVIMNLQTYYTY